ncbi:MULTISPECIES: hypothetical protein [unclassified Luteibacter]|jgi:hypothetical protein|uniref:hypothetical protein n=2 Tax=unclassified Luteibacter TaxID=2620188 RepID=UPI0033910581
MISSKRSPSARSACRAVSLATVGVLAVAAATVQAQAGMPSIPAQAQAQASARWHDTLTVQGPPDAGCYSALFPSAIWTPERCAPPPKHVSPPVHKVVDSRTGRVTLQAVAPTTGNGNDYAAQTNGLTRSAVGSFPAVTGVNAGGTQPYTLQINTTTGSNPAACPQYGYSSCSTWQQFLYDTGDGEGASVYIQDWLYVGSASEYASKGCPADWTPYADDQACYRNSDAISVGYFPLASLGSMRLSGVANQNGRDVVTLTVNGKSFTASQPATTLDIARIWKQSEFNVFGYGGDKPLVTFNPGSTVNVRLNVVDGSTNAPSCLQNAGTTFEQNNLTLGSCTASGGTSPGIQFSESN